MSGQNDQEDFYEKEAIFEANGLNVLLNGYGPGSFLAYARFCLLPTNSEMSRNSFEFFLAKEVAEKISKNIVKRLSQIFSLGTIRFHF